MRAHPDATEIALPTGTERIERKVPAGVVAAAVAGNAIEFYDFLTYAFFAVYIGKAFFPMATPFLTLLLSLGVFGVGFAMRPLGGLLFGALADRAGRKPTMLLTIGLMTLGTLGMALMPTYASVGMVAPIMVVVCRLLQGLALGGEVGPATAFLFESAPPHRRGLRTSWMLAGQGLASLVAGALGLLLSEVLDAAQLQAWGWRVPFALAALLMPVAIHLRRHMPDTLEVRPDEPRGTILGQFADLGRRRRLLALLVLIVMGSTVSAYSSSYMATYAMATLGLHPSSAMLAAFADGLAGTMCFLLGGWLADRYGRKPVMLLPRIALALLVYPCFVLLVEYRSLTALLSASVLLSSMTALSSAASLVAIAELVGAQGRALGISTVYAVGVSLFGGTTQFIVTLLIGLTGHPEAPAWYVAGTSLITVLAMLALPESRPAAMPLMDLALPKAE